MHKRLEEEGIFSDGLANHWKDSFCLQIINITSVLISSLRTSDTCLPKLMTTYTEYLKTSKSVNYKKRKTKTKPLLLYSQILWYQWKLVKFTKKTQTDHNIEGKAEGLNELPELRPWVNPLVSKPTALLCNNLFLLCTIFRVFNRVILFNMPEENALGEDLLMRKLLEISCCQRCKYLNIRKGYPKPPEHLKTFLSFCSWGNLKITHFCRKWFGF